MQAIISITNISSVSALGASKEEVWQSYFLGRPLFVRKSFRDLGTANNRIWVSQLSRDTESELVQLRRQESVYKKLDRSVLLAILAAKKAFNSKNYINKKIGVNVGSSRGATTLFEKYHRQFIETKKVSIYSSPTTTLGNISSWVGQQLKVDGPTVSHSVTCSTSLHSLLNGIAWLRADMADGFLVGGSEASLTSFTVAQMRALKLYSNSAKILACESMKQDKKKNTMVLGEAAAMAVIEKGISSKTQAVIKGLGYATELLEHGSSISANADCFQKSMKMALKEAKMKTVDAIILHAPGTLKGDAAEMNAINELFGKRVPLLTSNKWLVGHTFGASGMMSVEMAVLMMQNNRFIENPFFLQQNALDKDLNTILVNAVGFGGNAVSIILSKPEFS